MWIEVSEQNISDGKKCSKTSCPIGLAIKERLGLKHGVMVWPDRVKIKGKRIDLDERTAYAIEIFDATGFMKPIGFELDYEE